MPARLIAVILESIPSTEVLGICWDYLDDLLHFSIPDPWAWRERRRQRRIKAGLCQSCGYDLRAHKPGQCCPECGAPVPAGHVPTVAP
jgi:hypothetical protein